MSIYKIVNRLVILILTLIVIALCAEATEFVANSFYSQSHSILYLGGGLSLAVLQIAVKFFLKFKN